METHVKILAILKILGGSLALFAALFFFLVFDRMVGLIEREAGEPEREMVASMMAIAGITVIFILLALSIPAFIAAYGLFKHAEWARILSIVLAMLDLIWFPIGTALGIYGLWVLFNDETVALFKRR